MANLVTRPISLEIKYALVGLAIPRRHLQTAPAVTGLEVAERVARSSS